MGDTREVLVMTTCKKTIGKVSNAGSSLTTALLSKAVDVLVAHPLDLRDPSGSRARSAPKWGGRRSRTFRPNGLIPSGAASAEAVIRTPGD